MQYKSCNYLHLFAKNLKAQRKHHRLTKKQTAYLAGVTRKQQALYEKGEEFPCLRYILRLSEAGFELNKLLGMSDALCDRHEQILLELYRNANKETQHRVLQILLNGDCISEPFASTNQNNALLAGNQSITNFETKP